MSNLRIPEVNASRNSFDAIIGAEGSVVIDPDIEISSEEGDAALDGFFAYVNNPVGDDDFEAYDSSTDSLELTTEDVNAVFGDDATDICVEFDSATGVLKAVTNEDVDHGAYSADKWEALARKVKFETTGDESVKKQVRITLGNKLALLTENERIVVPEVYPFENEETTVDEILVAIEDKTYFGIQGHLATIRDEEVNQFVKDKIRNADGTSFDLVLLGARTTSDSTPDHKKFEWFVGPDAGLVFYDNGAVSGVFSEFNTNEPNHTSNDTNYINVTDNGKWNDTVIPNYNWTNKYLVIYEADAADLRFSVNYTISLVSNTEATTNLVEDLYQLGEKVEALENKQDIHAKLSECKIENNSLILTLNNEETRNLGNVQGPKGDTGERGERGLQGSTGEQGPRGDAGTPGARGQQGIQGERGDTGSPGSQGIQGVKGDAGEPGVQGPKGDKGDAGDDFNGDARVTNIEADYQKASEITRAFLEAFFNKGTSYIFGPGSAEGNGWKSRNTGFGKDVLRDLTSGKYNTAFGDAAGRNLTTAEYNVAVGLAALIDLVTGTRNVALGANIRAKRDDASFGTTVGSASNLDEGATILGAGNVCASAIDAVIQGRDAVNDETKNLDRQYILGVKGQRLIEGFFKVVDEDGTVTQEPSVKISAPLSARHYYLFSPNNTRYKITVSNAGELQVEEDPEEAEE